MSRILEYLGGEAHVKQAAPAFFAALTAPLASNTPGAGDAGLYNDDTFDTYLGVEQIHTGVNGIQPLLKSGFARKARFMAVVADVYDAKTGQRVDTYSFYDENTQHSEYRVQCASSIAKHAAKGDVRVNAHFTWTEDGVRAHEREVTYTVSQFYNEEPLIEGIHVTRPRAKDKKLTRVLYDREQFWNEETYDEHYTNVVAPDRKSAKLMMPFEGSLTMTEGFTVEEVETSIPGEQPELYLTLLDGSTIAYQNPKGIAAQFIISADQKSITWAFDDDWCARLDLSHFSASTILEFSCRLTLDVRHAALPTILHPRVMINSLADPSLRDSGVYEIEKIQIMWGCLAKDTPIRMADGSEKQAQNIRPGDRVQSGDKMMDVRDVLTGREAELVCLYTQNGCMVRVTAQHPIGTARGFVPAGQLNAADSIQTSAGSSPVKYLYTELYNDQVYNFLLEQTGPLWCGGIAAGDFEMQNTLERPLRAKSAPDTALIAEMRGLFAQNK